MAARDLPAVLVLAGHDATGGAGLVADAEAIAACGGWPLTVPTSLTVQTTRDVRRVTPASPDMMRETVQALVEDFEIAAIKLGLIADIATLEVILEVLRRLPGVPVVCDPVLRAGGGSELAATALPEALRERLLPGVDLLTPNRQELERLAPQADDDTARATELLSRGCQAVLITGTDQPAAGSDPACVTHTLHTPELTRQWHWPRLPGAYHGSGCTLAAAAAARLAAGERLVAACEQAQRFTWESLRHGWRPAAGQHLPRRLWQLPAAFDPEALDDRS